MSAATLPPQYPGRRIRVAMETAVRAFEQTILDEPHVARNYAAAAEWHIALWCYGFLHRHESLDRARQHAERALELDPQLAMAHTMRGVVHMGDWEWLPAEQSLRRGVELDGESAASHHWMALYWSALGQHQQAIQQSETAVKLAPHIGNQTGLGATLYFARDFERMARQMQNVIDSSPDFAEGYDWLGMALVQLGRFDEAITTYETAERLAGGLAEVKAGLGHAYGLAGRSEDARRILRDLEQLESHWLIPPVQIAFVQIGLDDHDAALARLEAAAEQKSWELAFVEVEPWLDEVREDARFATLRHRIAVPSPPGNPSK